MQHMLSLPVSFLAIDMVQYYSALLTGAVSLACKIFLLLYLLYFANLNTSRTNTLWVFGSYPELCD